MLKGKVSPIQAMKAHRGCDCKGKHIHSLGTTKRYMSSPVVPWLSYSPLDPKFTGSNPAGVDGFFSDRKNPDYDFLRKESKAVGPVS